MKILLFRIILFSLPWMLRIGAMRDKDLKAKLKEKNISVLIRLESISVGRLFTFKNGRIRSKSGINDADVTMTISNVDLALNLMIPPRDYLEVINAGKNFQVGFAGDDRDLAWFTETLVMVMQTGWKFGVSIPDGTTRYTSNTNGGPVFVYVKAGKIVRITPIEFEDGDAESWSIKARGKEFTPPRRTTVNPYTLAWKSMVYSDQRVLYPMKRVDFDPNGERNIQNRGISGYERISWDEALDIVSSEIKRVKLEHGPGAILNSSGSHHTWGHLGYWLSSRLRFFNSIGTTYTVHNPDSWEGWYWGAMHHWGNSMHLGAPETYGTVEDMLKECEMVVFWSSDPESTSGVYGAFEGTVRRLWLKELGIKMVHIDPFYNHTAALMGGKWLAPRPATGNALALAIAYVWITEDLYDKEYVAERTSGFDEWKAYVMGEEDGVPKTPEWQEGESAISAREVRALAREWAKHKTYLSAGGLQGFGGACRCATGTEWARSMVCLMAMQGLGKPGINMGCMQQGSPVDCRFFFPGYSEGGLSGDTEGTALAVNMYQRMPQLPTMNTVYQKVPRLQIPEAIMDQKAEGFPTDSRVVHGQFMGFKYPAPGHAPVRMYYKYGGSHIGTMNETNRYARMYRSENLEFAVSQAIWMEGETKLADVILPACTSFERWDISEFANCGGYVQHSFTQVNHRVAVMQHKCIEPLGESKSDWQIFFELAQRLGLSAPFAEGSNELEWCKRMFDGTDLPKHVSWKKFLKRGYFVIPNPPEDQRAPVAFRWYAEDRMKDTPEICPLPGDYAQEFGKGIQTQTGKLEFSSSSLKRYDADDPERPVISKYIPSWEGHHTTELYEKFPLQLITPHPRYSFHTMGDGKDSIVNDVKDHRVLIDGYYYWIVRINPVDAKARDIGDKELVKVYNDRGAVICSASLTERIPAGTLHSYESAATYDPIGTPGESPDRGGCMNILTSKRPMIKKSHSHAANSCLVQIEKWDEEASK